MQKTAKELAYLRDLYLNDEWTRRFTELVDKNINFDNAGEILYLHAGTGAHPLALEENVSGETAIFALCDDEYELSIASEKASATGSKVEFSTKPIGEAAFSHVIADLSLKAPEQYAENIEAAIRKAKPSGEVAVFLPTAGSFGEVFSLLWEVLSASETALPVDVEELIANIPTVSRAEDAASKAGLTNIKTATATEVFDFETGDDVANSPLVADFLFPLWFSGLDDDQRTKIRGELAGLISGELGDLSFQFAVKATLITGKRA